MLLRLAVSPVAVNAALAMAIEAARNMNAALGEMVVKSSPASALGAKLPNDWMVASAPKAEPRMCRFEASLSLKAPRPPVRSEQLATCVGGRHLPQAKVSQHFPTLLQSIARPPTLPRSFRPYAPPESPLAGSERRDPSPFGSR